MLGTIGVKVKGGNVEKALRKFRRKVKDSNIMVDWKKHQYFTKPSKKRRDERHKGKKRTEERLKEHYVWDRNSRYYEPRG